MYQKPAGPLRVSSVVEDAVRLYWASFNRAWVPALILQLFVTGALAYAQIETPELFEANGLALDPSKITPSLITLYFVAVFASLIVSNAITAQLLAVREGRDLTIRASLATGAAFFLPMLGLIFLLGAAGGLLTAVAGAATAALPAAAQKVLLVLDAMLVIYLLGRVFLAGIPLLGEGAGVPGAIRTSWRITRHHWWRAAAITGMVVLLFLVTTAILQLCGSVLNLVVRSDTMAGLLAVQLVSAVIQAAIVPFLNAGFVSTYYDLKIRNQGAGVAAGPVSSEGP